MTTATLADSGLDDPRDDSSVPVSVAAVIDCYAAVSFYPGSTPLFVPGPAGLDFARIAANQRSDGALPGIDLLAERCSERQARAISPLKHVDARFPPTMIVHGTDDKLILPTNSQRLDHVLSNLGAVSQLVTFAGCSHEFDMAPSYAAVLTGHIDLFLRRVLADPDLAAEVAEYGAFA
jgi:acetyl esterase/lipase